MFKQLKKIIMILTLVSINSVLFSQGEVMYEIQRNDPCSVNNFMAYISPISVDFSKSHFSLGFGLGAYYNYKNKFTIDLGFRRSYSEKINFLAFSEKEAKFNGDVKYGQAFGDVKNLMVYEFTGQYLIGGHIFDGVERVVLKEVLNQYTSYVKVKAQRYHAFPVRLGFGHYQSNMSTQWMNSINFFYQGYDVNLSNDSVESIQGSTMYYANTINLGLAFYQKHDMKIKFEGSYNGTKDFSSTTLYYIDVLFPIYQEFQNMDVIEKSIINGNLISNHYEYNVNENTPTSPCGIRFGMKYRTLRKINGSYTAEVGFNPGPIDFKTNFYIFMGLEINISKKTKHYK